VTDSKDTNVLWTVVAPAKWPASPPEMSVSTHSEIEECPRRWALSAAEYPELWSGRGYPPKLQVATLAGSVVHLALETITKRFVHAGVSSQADPLAANVLRDLGGFTKVVQNCLERVLARFVDNPRATAHLEHARRTLRGQVPALRTRVQATLSRLRLPATALSSPTPPPSASARSPLASGVYPEIELRARQIGWKGKVDLLVLRDDTCEITDFKTGAIDEAHKFQVRVYAILWMLDEDLNPARRAVDRLLLTYEAQDLDVAPPSESETDTMTEGLVQLKRAAEVAVAARPPQARPSVDTCRYCSVRQLCDEYWANPVAPTDPQFGDIELEIVRRHGPTSWDAVVLRSATFAVNSPALLRLPHAAELPTGGRVRVLDGTFARDTDDSGSPLIVTLSAFSETYWVR